MYMDLIDFSNVRNRNEKLVLRAIEALLASQRGLSYRELLSAKDYHDIYALALNQLPSRYAQPGTIILGNPVRDEDATNAVYEAFETVLRQPKE